MRRTAGVENNIGTRVERREKGSDRLPPYFDVGAAEWLLRLGDLRRVQEREEQEEREREEVGGPEPGEYDYDPDQGYARAVESDERWAECVEALFSRAGAGGGD